MRDQNKIKAKIAALLAKARGTDNEHEAATFLAKALEMLEQHQLTMGDIEDADDPVKWAPGLDCMKWTASWQADIYYELALMYGCKAIKSMKSKTGYFIELVGRESAIITTDLMFDFVKGECNKLGRELYKTGGAPDAQKGARLVGNALAGRIRSLRPKPEAAPRTDAVGRNQLVTQDRVLALWNDLYGKTAQTRSARTGTSKSARELAAGIGLNRQTGGASQLRLK